MDSVSSNRPSHPNAKPVTAPAHASQVLGRVKDFLGVMSEANRRLENDAKENPENYDIEVLNGSESRIIEMDLMLGIADLHTAEAISAAESAIAGYQLADSLSACSSGTDSEDTLDDGENDDDDDDDDDNGDDDGIGDRDCLDNRVPGELRKSNSHGDVSSEMTGKNRRKKHSKRPKIVEFP